MGPQRNGLRRGRYIPVMVLLFLFFLPVLCATACRGASLMQEPSGLLAPSLRVLSFFVTRLSETSGTAAPLGLWPSHARGASIKTPRATCKAERMPPRGDNNGKA